MKNKKGFTLIEVLVVITVTGILFSIIALLTSSFINNYKIIMEANSTNNEIINTFSLFDSSINEANLDGKEIKIDVITVKSNKYVYVFADNDLLFELFTDVSNSKYLFNRIENPIPKIKDITIAQINNNKGLRVDLITDFGSEYRVYNVLKLEVNLVNIICNQGDVVLESSNIGDSFVITTVVTPFIGKRVDYWEENDIRISISDGYLQHSFIPDDGLTVKVYFKEN